MQKLLVAVNTVLGDNRASSYSSDWSPQVQPQQPSAPARRVLSDGGSGLKEAEFVERHQLMAPVMAREVYLYILIIFLNYFLLVECNSCTDGLI